jgi:hypothetical protein
MKTRLLSWILVAIMTVIIPAISGCAQNPTQLSTPLLKFKKMTYTDNGGTGIEAFSFLMPSDWQFEGGIWWLLDQPAMPANSSIRVFNPAGAEEFEVLPNSCFFWTTNLQLLGMFPPGSKYFGTTVKKPVSAIKTLSDLVVPWVRGNMPGLKVISNNEFPELIKFLGIGKNNSEALTDRAEAAKIRITYQKNGIPIDEEIWGVVEQISFPVKGMFGVTYNTLWYVHYLISYKAEKGKLENHTKTFQTITSSFKINPQWQAKYNNMIEYLAKQQIQQIRSAGELSRMLSQMSDQMRSDQLEQFEQRSNVYDKVAQMHSDNILGIDRYFDPYEGREVELPSGYNHVWCNNRGEYVLTDNPNYNPNVGDNLSWQPIEKK